MECGILQQEQNLANELPDVWFQAAVFMTNILKIVARGNQTAIRFGMPMLSLREYLV